MRRHEQRLVGALLLREARHEHVRRVGERLDPVEDARRRRSGSSRARSSPGSRAAARAAAIRRPPRVATSRRYPSAPAPPASSSPAASAANRSGLNCSRSPAADRAMRSRCSSSAYGTPRIHPSDLEHAIPPKQPLVQDRDRRILRRHHLTIKTTEHDRDPLRERLRTTPSSERSWMQAAARRVGAVPIGTAPRRRVAACAARSANHDAPAWNRTKNLRIKSPLLCQLSYRGGHSRARSAACGRVMVAARRGRVGSAAGALPAGALCWTALDELRLVDLLALGGDARLDELALRGRRRARRRCVRRARSCARRRPRSRGRRAGV